MAPLPRPVVSMSPHVRHGRTIRHMILTQIAALVPALLFGVIQFGAQALLLVLVGVAGAVLAEAAVCKASGRPLSLDDYHAVLVGLVLVLLVPPGVPWWLVLVGGAAAILIGKAPFGPLGGSPIHPALVGLLVVAISWPEAILTYSQPLSAGAALAAVPAEAPLTAVAMDPSDALEYSLTALFLGDQAGSIGTISPLFILLGGLFLIHRRAGRWQGPVGFLLGMGLAGWIMHAVAPGSFPPASFHLFTGAAFFGAFFLTNDFTSTPVTPWGCFLFGLTAGSLALVFRVTEGLGFGRVAFAVAFVSLLTPLLDRIGPVPFGKGVRHA